MSDELKAGDVIQMRLAYSTGTIQFAGCLMIVEEVKAWGVKCFCLMPGGDVYHYRAQTGEFDRVGPAPHVRKEWLG